LREAWNNGQQNHLVTQKGLPLRGQPDHLGYDDRRRRESGPGGRGTGLSRTWGLPVKVLAPGEGPTAPEVEERELQRQRETQERRTQRRAVISLVGNATMLLVAGPLYRYHWRKIEKGSATDSPE